MMHSNESFELKEPQDGLFYKDRAALIMIGMKMLTSAVTSTMLSSAVVPPFPAFVTEVISSESDGDEVREVS